MLAVGSGFPQKAQELFEALVGACAVVVLLSMVFWMKKAARSIRATMEHEIDAALAERDGPAWALIGMTFFAVAREGLESVFFLLAIFQQSQGAAAPVGALLGVAAATLLGYGIYRGGIRLDLRRFFRWTGIFIIFVAAGLASSVLRNLHEAGLWNHLQQPIWDLTQALPVSSVLGDGAERALRLPRRAGAGRGAGLDAGARRLALALPAAGAGRPFVTPGGLRHERR